MFIFWAIKFTACTVSRYAICERRGGGAGRADENFKLPLHHVVELHLVTSQPTYQCYKEEHCSSQPTILSRGGGAGDDTAAAVRRSPGRGSLNPLCPCRSSKQYCIPHRALLLLLCSRSHAISVENDATLLLLLASSRRRNAT